QVRQAVARFSVPATGFGDRTGPPRVFVVDCPTPGAGRWVDPRTWVYDFAAEVLGGVRCTFALDPDLQAASGEAGRGGQALAIRFTSPAAGEITEDQTFLVALDAVPTPASLATAVGFAADGVPERIDVDVVGGADRDQVVKARYHDPTVPADDRVLVLRARR